ncbi:hypothetical protein SAMN05216464_110218 [Mucilaginibacter pineti]|uniref:Uncharacterized protein n=1 Tax=Mucilaginibacter pineti TaxID=1391627 RepID=A0A1G7GMV3_9SPHI|nr:hypothetical protein [Mucilaginibacter pineti]SDE89454.1 hypothetical protein SAMN05216464_110218 [Mucilaginibacter pineti]
MSNKISTKKSGFQKYRWLLIGTVSIIIIAGLVLANKSFLQLYYLNAKNNHYKLQDRIFAKKYVIDEHSYILNLYRKIRPIDKNSSGKPYMIECAWAISVDSLKKYKTTCIGTYTGYKIYDVKAGDNFHPMIFFSLVINKKALVKQTGTNLYDLPSGYTYEDGPFYVLAIQTSNKDAF